MPQHVNGNGERVLLTPMMCRLRNLSYLTTLKGDLLFTRQREGEGGKTEVIDEFMVPGLEIAKLPVMLGSRMCYTYGTSKDEKRFIEECGEDKGGYFIIKGSEKVLVGQERES